MTKKIGPKTTKTPSSIKSTDSVSGTNVTSVGSVDATKQAKRAGNIRQPTRRLTPAERDKLFNMVREEADKLFGPNGLPESKREVVEGAVQMAIDGGMVDEDE